MKEELKSFNEKEVKYEITKGIDLIKKVEGEPEPIMLWEGISKGSTGLITGIAKTGKTTFAENLAISLSIGSGTFFNHPIIEKPQKVLFLNLEEGYRLTARRNRKQISTLSENQMKLFHDNYMVSPEKFIEYVNTEDDWKLLSDYIERSEADIVFIDSLSHMLVGEIEKSSVYQQFDQKFRKYIKQLGKTVIVIHHNTKGNNNPIVQSNIAGSRYVSQEFEYAYGLAKVPTGGSYGCMLFNKEYESDDTLASLYTIDQNRWFKYVGQENKYNLYHGVSKRDGRIDETNKNIVYDYIVNLTNQGNKTISTRTLKEGLVLGANKKMSSDTFFQSIGKLITDGKLEKEGRGLYKLPDYEERRLHDERI